MRLFVSLATAWHSWVADPVRACPEPAAGSEADADADAEAPAPTDTPAPPPPWPDVGSGDATPAPALPPGMVCRHLMSFSADARGNVTPAAVTPAAPGVAGRPRRAALPLGAGRGGGAVTHPARVRKPR